jgi:hypothetical protein
VLVYAATRPEIFTVQRSIAVNAPPAQIHPLINDFSRWGAWSPYETKDPAMKREFSATTAGEGATYAWQGNKDVGHGRMRIAESTPSRIAIQLDFLKPFEAHNIAEFTLQPQGHSTSVTWAMRGHQTFMCKVMSLFFNMDRMIGTDFEAGLINLKTAAEQ